MNKRYLSVLATDYENAIYHGIEGIAEDTNIYKGNHPWRLCTIEITDEEEV